MWACRWLSIFVVAIYISSASASACCRDKTTIDACVYDNLDCETDCDFVSDGAKCVCRENIPDRTVDTCDLSKPSEAESSNNEAFILSLVSLTICIGLTLFVLIWVYNYKGSTKWFSAKRDSKSVGEIKPLLDSHYQDHISASAKSRHASQMYAPCTPAPPPVFWNPNQTPYALHCPQMLESPGVGQGIVTGMPPSLPGAYMQTDM